MRKALGLLASVALAGGAQAATFVQDFYSYSRVASPVASFNTNLGTLESITITYVGQASAEFQNPVAPDSFSGDYLASAAFQIFDANRNQIAGDGLNFSGTTAPCTSSLCGVNAMSDQRSVTFYNVQDFSKSGLTVLASGGVVTPGTQYYWPGTSQSVSGTLTYNYSAAPEPASWAMMLAGFGFVGSAVRRKRPVVA